jgi:hypothetical protein
MGLDVERSTLWFDGRGPWLSLDVWVHLEGERKFVLWRATGAVYPVDEHGAAADDPIVPGWDAGPLRNPQRPLSSG